MMYTKEEFKDYLKKKGEEWDVKSFFSKVTREEDYRLFVKSEADDELNYWLSYSENMELVVLNKIYLEERLSTLEYDGAIEYFERDGATYKVRTSRYDVYLRLLHFGHVVLYTINHKTNRKANYSKGMFSHTIFNILVKFL